MNHTAKHARAWKQKLIYQLLLACCLLLMSI